MRSLSLTLTESCDHICQIYLRDRVGQCRWQVYWDRLIVYSEFILSSHGKAVKACSTWSIPADKKRHRCKRNPKKSGEDSGAGVWAYVWLILRSRAQRNNNRLNLEFSLCYHTRFLVKKEKKEKKNLFLLTFDAWPLAANIQTPTRYRIRFACSLHGFGTKLSAVFVRCVSLLNRFQLQILHVRK